MSDMADIGGIPEIVVSLMQAPEELKQEMLRYRMAGIDERPHAFLHRYSQWYIHKSLDSDAGIPLVLKERKQ